MVIIVLSFNARKVLLPFVFNCQIYENFYFLFRPIIFTLFFFFSKIVMMTRGKKRKYR